MRTRAMQVAIIIALGAGIGLLVTRPWQGSDETQASATPVPDTTSSSAQPPTSASSRATDSQTPIAPPTPRSFKLPTMSAVTPATQPKVKDEAKRPPPNLVPRHWLLRGTGPSGYDIKSDRAQVFTGQSSVQIVSHNKDVAATKNASLMQTIIAGDWAGQRVEFSMSTRPSDFRRYIRVWIRATDSGGAVIAYDESSSAYGKPEWKKSTIIMDVPWSAAEVAYGITLEGPGSVWVDNAELRAVDKAIGITGQMRPSELGVVVQTADRNGPLATPNNMDFEDVVPADDLFRELPKDELGKARF
jgi:hypothetical protein